MKSSEKAAQNGLAPRALESLFRSEFVRFVIAGAINTAATYLLYLVLLYVVPYILAYTISYVCGIVISCCLNAWFVFRRKITLAVALPYPAVYVLQYVLGVALLTLLVGHMGMNPRIAPVVVILCTVPATFLLTRFIFRRGSESA
jgi:putative flippase GtrA